MKRSIIYNGIKTLIAIIFSVLIYYYRGKAMQNWGIDYFNQPEYIVDAISTVGFLYFFFGLLIFVSNKGAFYGISYSFRKLLSSFKMFDGMEVEKSYFDYVNAKEADEDKIKSQPFLLIGLVFIFISFILIYIYKLY